MGVHEAFERRLARLRGAIEALALVVAFGLIPGGRLRAIEFIAAEPESREPPSLVVASRDRIGAARVTIRTPDGVAIPGAVVRALVVRDGTLLLAGRAVTSADGTARIEGLSLGAHWLVADAEGRARASSQRFVSGGDVDAELRLGPARSLEIEVHNQVGRPMSGVELEIHGVDPLPRGARTGADGVAKPQGLGAGVLRILARAPGFEDATIVARDDATDAPDHAAPRVSVAMQRLGALTVTVLDADRRSVDGATISIAGGRLAVPRTTVTDASGVARIAGLAAGSYDLRAVKGTLVSPVEIGVPLAKGAETTTRLTLVEGRHVSVHVVDEQGAAVADARVSAVEDGLGPFPSNAVADAHGDATIAPVAAAQVVVSVRADGYVGRTAMLVGSLAANDAKPATIVTLRRAATLVGDVRDASGAAIDGASIEIVGTDLDGQPFDVTPATIGFRDALIARASQSVATLLPVGELGVVPGPVPPIPRAGAHAPPSIPGGAESTVARAIDPWITDSAGDFHATPLPPGKMQAIARHPAYVDGVSEPVDIAAGGSGVVHVVLAAGGRLIGRVKDETGRPVAGVYLEAVSRIGALTRGTRSASDGTFVLASVPREITLDVAAPDRPTDVVLRIALTVPEGGQKEQEIVLPAPRASLLAHVVDDRRYPIRGAQVTVSSLDPSAPAKLTAFTDDHGDAEIARVAGLRAVIDVSAPGYAPRHESVHDAPTKLELELAQGLAVRGVVRSPGGRSGQKGAVVTLRIASSARDGGVATLRATTDDDGGYRFVDAPKGEGVLTVVASGTAGAREAVHVTPIGSLPEVELPRVEVGAAGAVEGEVVDALGRGVAGVRVGREHVARWVPAAGAGASAVVVTDALGGFKLFDVGVGETEIAAFSAEFGVGKSDRIRVDEGRSTTRVRITLQRDTTASSPLPTALGVWGLAITFAEGTSTVLVVAAHSEAERAGVFEGDEILSVDGAPISGEASARPRLDGAAGTDAIVVVRRAGVEHTLRIPREMVRD